MRLHSDRRSWEIVGGLCWDKGLSKDVVEKDRDVGEDG